MCGELELRNPELCIYKAAVLILQGSGWLLPDNKIHPDAETGGADPVQAKKSEQHGWH